MFYNYHLILYHEAIKHNCPLKCPNWWGKKSVISYICSKFKSINQQQYISRTRHMISLLYCDLRIIWEREYPVLEQLLAPLVHFIFFFFFFFFLKFIYSLSNPQKQKIYVSISLFWTTSLESNEPKPNP